MAKAAVKKAAKGSKVHRVIQASHMGKVTKDAQSSTGAGSPCAQTHAPSDVEHHWFNPLLTSPSLFVKALNENISGTHELGLWGKERERKPKQEDQETFRRLMCTILTNLALAAAESRNPAAFRVSLRASHQKLTRYDAGGFARLPAILAEVSDTLSGFALSKARYKGEASVFTASEQVHALLSRVPLSDFKLAAAPETIWLSRTSHNYFFDATSRELIDYEDTDETLGYRGEMGRINAGLRNADIKLLTREGKEASPLLTMKRELHRSFVLRAGDGKVERFDQGGRLFGGFWLILPSTERRLIRLDGEPVADLDFDQMFLRLAYLEAGLEPPADADLYGNLSARLTGARWRDGIKKVVSSYLFREKAAQRLPRGTKDLLPAGSTAVEVYEATVARHPALEKVFGSGCGWRLMFQESQILVSALLRLGKQNVTALPMHDGIMVPRSQEDKATRALRAAAKEIVGFALPVSSKPLK